MTLIDFIIKSLQENGYVGLCGEGCACTIEGGLGSGCEGCDDNEDGEKWLWCEPAYWHVIECQSELENLEFEGHESFEVGDIYYDPYKGSAFSVKECWNNGECVYFNGCKDKWKKLGKG